MSGRKPRKDPKRVAAGKKAALTRRRDDDAVKGRITTDPLIARCPCGEGCRLKHTRNSLSYIECAICGASNLNSRSAAIA